MTRRGLLLLFLGLLACPALAQPGPGLFGDRRWRAPIATAIALPVSGALGEVRLTLDDGALHFWDGDSWEPAGAAGSGEANTASNLGGGLAAFDSKSGVDLRFNSFAAADFDLAANVLTIDDTKWAKDSELPVGDDDVPEAGDFSALALTGDVTSAGLVTTIAANSVDLGADTTGAYVSSATASQGLTLTGSEGASLGLQDCAANEILKRNAGDTAWDCATGGAGGDVVGPASAADNAIARYDGTTGKLLQSGAAVVTDAGGLTTGTVTGSGNFALQLRAVYNGSAKLLSIWNDGEGEIMWIEANGGLYLADEPLIWQTGGAAKVRIEPNGGDAGMTLTSDMPIRWKSGPITGTPDAQINRAAAGVVRLQDALQLSPLAAPPTCDSGAAGRIYHDTAPALCWCSGVAWVEVAPVAGGTSCQ